MDLIFSLLLSKHIHTWNPHKYKNICTRFPLDVTFLECVAELASLSHWACCWPLPNSAPQTRAYKKVKVVKNYSMLFIITACVVNILVIIHVSLMMLYMMHHAVPRDTTLFGATLPLPEVKSCTIIWWVI